jgi:hypothetical protein
MNTNNHAPQSEVEILRRQVERHLSLDHEFVCVREAKLPGWWGKLELFTRTRSRRNLYLDLDVTITDNIDALVAPLSGSQLRIAKNWAQSGHGGCQSSVMYWEDALPQIYDEFDPDYANWPPRNDLYWGSQVAWGDQEWITFLRDSKRLAVEYFNPAHVVSYKYHCRLRGAPPHGSLVQVFHGRPNPEDCSEGWIRSARS